MAAIAGGKISTYPASTVYATLRSLAVSGQLPVGQKFRITDFRTRHTIPLTSEINTGMQEVLVVTAMSPHALEPIAFSESYPQDVIEYELVNTLPDPAFDKGRILYRRDTRKDIWSFEDWRAIKYRRGRNSTTGKFTEISDFSKGYVDLYPFNNSPDPSFTNRVHVGRANGSQLSNIVVGTGKSAVSDDISIGSGCNSITIGDNSDIIDIGNVNGNITIGDNSHHIRIGVCSDYTVVGDRCSYINIGMQSCSIVVKNEVFNSSVGDNVRPMVLGNGVPVGEIYVGNGIYIDPPPVITAPGSLEKYRSTLSAVVDVTGQEHLFLDSLKHAGIIRLTSKKGAQSISRIFKTPDPNETDFPIELRPSPGLVVTVVGTSFEALSGDGQILVQGNLVLDGDKGDSVILKRKSVGQHAIFTEISRFIY
ncbi:hypothetical protein [Geotalea toluenoxydans]|uniref:hypothetical protein n=1 Tax=Geotalea toluenoxydans TaxID=421624 RepID=UPI0006D17612|nr:hypothetical protein [Geotalea toluenoxydans]